MEVRMGLFDRTAKRLASGPTLALAAGAAGPMAEALRAYDPALRERGDRVVFGNGVRLHGPVELTPELIMKARLPAGLAVAYYADGGARGSRPGSVTWQDAERLVRGLAARLGAVVHDSRLPMKLNLSATVYSTHPAPAADVISVLQPFTDDRLFVHESAKVPDAYFLVSGQEPRFLTAYWPPRLSRSRLALPPPALGGMRDARPCRWELRSKFPADSAEREIRLTVGSAAMALAGLVAGVIIDPYGFPVTRPEDLLPR
jgi:hypothetical protein